MAAQTTTPAVTPVESPSTTPWKEHFTPPDEICDQQVRELASPEIGPQAVSSPAWRDWLADDARAPSSTEHLVLGGPHVLYRSSKMPGRRLRVLARLGTAVMFDVPVGSITLADALAVAEADEGIRCRLSSKPIIQQLYGDPELTAPLQDLAWQIAYDLTEACAAIFDRDAWYPGVDDGIEPVPDAFVETVIAATQRELNRELRMRPAVQLATDLPWRVQRAFVERRRWRYNQWGIDRAASERGTFSLWDVREDSDWVPPWAA